ncbi:MAG: FAD-dependent oxidoreductase [Acidobacteria bacterium]|nr:FAD-dependent oxidoreductase [Acidobacteriota bacterium]
MNIAFPLHAAQSASPAKEPGYDLVVYGGTSGGVIAAVQAAKMGRKVVLVSPTRNLGGLTASGLGTTDTGGWPQIIGGLASEFYTRIHRHYEDPKSWKWVTRE